MIDLVERLRDADANSQQRILGSRIFGEAADRISQQDAELERWKARAEAAEAKLAEARKAAFIEAAEIAEKVAAGQDQEWRTDTAMRVAYAIRAKAEETRT